tara:strand:- start:101 stop:628 length:528 start_codon:yes stop_codon:yes gene_type:complete
MKISYLPIFLKDIIDINQSSLKCTKCNNGLIKEIRKIDFEHECGSCKHPYGQSGGCTCWWETIDKLCIICNKCCKCLICNQLIDDFRLEWGDTICNQCAKYKRRKEDQKEKVKNKKEFIKKWKKSTIVEKLELYGCIKLKKLARMKNIKNINKMNKFDLICALVIVTTHDDFPIY